MSPSHILIAGLLVVAALCAQTAPDTTEETGKGRVALDQLLKRIAALDSGTRSAIPFSAAQAGLIDPMLILLKSADPNTREALLAGSPPSMRKQVEVMMNALGEVSDQQFLAAAEELTPLLEPQALACAEAFGLYIDKQYKNSAEKYEAAFKLGSAASGDYYNAACSWALAGNKEAAFRNLNEAVSRDFDELSRLEQDEDLISLRSDRRWRALIDRLQQARQQRLATLPDTLKPLRTIALPAPEQKGNVSVEEALTRRRSVRQYATSPLALKEVSQVLWAAYGVTRPQPEVPYMRGGTRTAPSAGALYPLDIYLFAGNVTDLPAGIYRYKSETHELELLFEGDRRKSLFEASWQQACVRDAPASLVFSAVFERTTKKYGTRGRERYVCMDLGHSGENVYLQCGVLGLGTVAIGAFEDDEVKLATGMTKVEEPLYIMPFGRLRSSK